MSTTDLGIYNLTVSIYMVLITIVGSSIPLTISKITAKNNATNNTNETKYSVTTSMILTTTVAILISIFTILIKPLFVNLIGDSLGYELILYLLPSVVFTAVYAQIRGYLWGIENYFAVSIVEFVEQILRIALCLIFVNINVFHSSLISVGLALSIACGLSTFLGIYLYYRNKGRFAYKKGYFKPIIQSTLPLTGVRIFNSLLQPIISIIIPISLTTIGFSKEMALSELGIIMGMTMPILSIPSTIIGALCMILIPRLNNTMGNYSKTNVQIRYYIKFTLTCIFIFLPIFITLGEPICSVIFKNSIAGHYLSISAWITIPMGLAQITTSILNALNQEHKSFIYYLISSVALIIFIIIATPLMGILSMSYGFGICNTILFILNLYKIKKTTKLKSNTLINLLSYILILLPTILLDKSVYSILIRIIPPIYSIGITAICSIIIYLIFIFTFNILDRHSVKVYLMQFTKKSPST